MQPKLLSVLLLLAGSQTVFADILGLTLSAAKVPLRGFTELELEQTITSYAVSAGDPFLIAYYVDNGSGGLDAPLRVIRVDRKMGKIRRTALPDHRDGCLGAALRVREHSGRIFIETHVGPSTGCILVLSTVLAYEAAVPGGLLGFLGPDEVIVHRNEIHFASVDALHLEVHDLVHNRSVEVYPPKASDLRERYSRLIQPHISRPWCRENNAECDPNNFDTGIASPLAINEGARAFAFEAAFDADGFGEAAKKNVAPRKVFYIFRERAGKWEHREFGTAPLRRFAVATIAELVARMPAGLFGDSDKE